MTAATLNRTVRRVLRQHGLRPERLESTAVRGYKRTVAGFVTRVADRGVVITHRDATDWLGHPQPAIMRLETIRRVLDENGIVATLEATDDNIYPWRLVVAAKKEAIQ